MFLKNLLLSLGIIGVSTLHFASAAHAAGGQIQLLMALRKVFWSVTTLRHQVLPLRLFHSLLS